jgi:hypothetical protein
LPRLQHEARRFDFQVKQWRGQVSVVECLAQESLLFLLALVCWAPAPKVGSGLLVEGRERDGGRPVPAKTE